MSDIESNVLEELQAKHRKEKKELQAKIQAMKKNVSKDRKKKILEEIAELENNLEKKQALEISALKENKDQTNNIEIEVKNLNIGGAEGIDIVTEQHTNQRISKAQKRREKKAIEEKLRDAEILAQEELNKSGPRLMEQSAIKALLKSRGLSIYSIQSDGDCLYNAIIHQLKTFGKNVLNVTELRLATADFIEKNKTNLLPYMTNQSGDSLSDDEFEKYCMAIRNTPAWGGQIEIQALSNILEVPIEVLQSSGPPTVQGENEYKGPNLVITYHRHMYSLGEHYNSTQPFIDEDGQEDNISN